MSLDADKFQRGPEQIRVDDELTMQMTRADDGPRAYAFIDADRGYFGAHMDYIAGYTEQQAVEQYQAAQERIDAGSLFNYWMLAAPVGETAGLVNMGIYEDGHAELGYLVARHMQRRGFATRGARALMRLAVERKVPLVEMHMRPDNSRSKRVARLLKAEYIRTQEEERAGTSGEYEVWGVRPYV